MQSLRRTAVGGFRLEDALTLGALQELKDAGRLTDVVRPVDSVFEDCPALHIGRDFGKLLENGNPIAPAQTAEQECHAAHRWVRFYRQDGSFAAIYAYQTEKQKYMPVKMFLDR